jgi:hypothetical protein
LVTDSPWQEDSSENASFLPQRWGDVKAGLVETQPGSAQKWPELEYADESRVCAGNPNGEIETDECDPGCANIRFHP